MAKRTGEGTVEVWQPGGAYESLVSLEQFAAANAGCVAVRPLQCSEQQRSVLQAQFDSVVQQIEAAGTANALDAVSSYLYRQTKTSNPQPAHTGLTPARRPPSLLQLRRRPGRPGRVRLHPGWLAEVAQTAPPTPSAGRVRAATEVYGSSPWRSLCTPRSPSRRAPRRALRPEPRQPPQRWRPAGQRQQQGRLASCARAFDPKPLRDSDAPALRAGAGPRSSGWFKTPVRTAGNR